MKKRVILSTLVCSCFVSPQLHAQFNSTQSLGGTNPQYNNAGVGINLPAATVPSQDMDLGGNISVRGTHVVFNSQFGVIDWGSGTTGDLIFRTLSTQGSISGYTERFIIKNNGNVGVGLSNPDYSRLQTSQTFNSTLSNPSIPRNGGRFEINTSVPGTFIGTSGYANTTNGGGSTNMIGAYGEGVTSGGSAFNLNRGVQGVASGGLYNYGGDFQAYGGSSGVGTGIRATGTGVVGSLAGQFNGAVEINGDLGINGTAWCTNMMWGSDQKLKKDIKPFISALDKLKLLKPATYTFKVDEFKSLNLPDNKQIGLIAQELEKVFPELVSEIKGRDHVDKDGVVTDRTPDFKAVNYIGLIPVLISGIQELQKQVEEQKALIDALNKPWTATGINQHPTGLEDFTLDQNIPNPFSNETVIGYTLPKEVSAASLIVYDLSGKQIMAVRLETTSSSITFSSEKLAPGIYIYSVVADGKILNSKRMVVAQK